MELLIQIGQMVLMLSILVILHEFGHYLPAKLFKTKVEKFYLFFDPYFALIKKKIGETEYGIGWLPLGGYVKIAGMIDESMDKEQMKSEPKPWEFRSKPAWQRLIIMLGGVTVNVLLAWVILAGVFSYYGHKYDSVEKINENGGLMFGEVGKGIGFQDGDQIISVDGKKQKQFNRQVLDVLLGDKVTVKRGDELVTIDISDTQRGQIFELEGKGFISPRLKGVIVDTIIDGTAKQSGMKKGDKIIGITGKSINYYDELKNEIIKSKGDTVTLKILRDEQPIDLPVFVPDSAQIGFAPSFTEFNNLQVKNEYNFFTAFPVAIEESVNILVYNIKNIRLIFKPETKAYKQVKSFIGITRVLPTTWNWEFFWKFTAMFSMWLAFMNIIPIPGLDGGHALFTIAEMVTGRKLNDKAMGVVQTIGMFILLGLMVLLFGKDIYDLIVEKFVTNIPK